MAAPKQDNINLTVTVNGKQVSNTIADLQKAYKQLEIQRKNLNIGSAEYKQVEAEAKKVKALLDEQRLAVNGVKSGVGGLGGAFTGLGATIKAAFSPLALITAAIGIAIKFGEAIAGDVKQLAELRQELSVTAGLSGAELNAVATRVDALSKTYKVENEGLIQGARASANAFGLSYEQSLNLIRDGLLVTGNQSGEFLEQVKEYSVQFQQAGFSAEQAFGIIATGLNQGVFTDKAADAVKEFNLRIKDLTNGQRTALENLLGPDAADGLVSGIKQGTITAQEALTQVSGKVKEFGTDSATAQAAVSNLFGGAGEDAGIAFIASLADANEGISSLVDETNNYVQAQKDLEASQTLVSRETNNLAAAFDGAGSTLTVFWNIIKFQVIKQINDLVNAIKYFPEYVGATLEILKQLGNLLIDLFNPVLQQVDVLLKAFQKVSGIDLKLPKLEIPKFEINQANTFAGVENKINGDRAAYLARQEALKLAEKNKVIQAEQEAAAEAEKKKADAAIEAAQKESDRIAQERARLELAAQKKLEDLQVQLIANEDERKIAQLRLTAARELESIGPVSQAAELKKAIEEKLARDVAAVQDAANKKRIEEAQKTAKAEDDTRQKVYAEGLKVLDEQAKAAALRATQEVIQAAETGAIRVEDVETVLAEKLRAITEDNLQARYDYALANGGDLIDIEKQIADAQIAEIQRVAEADAKAAAARQADADARFSKINEGVQIAGQITTSFLDLQRAVADRQLQQDIDTIERRKQAELNAAGDNAKKKEAIEKKFQLQKEQLEKQAAKQRKTRAIIDAVINTALSVSAALATPPAPNVPAAILAGVLGGLQIATISAQAAAKGGMTGVTDGGERITIYGSPITDPGGMVNQPRLFVAGEKGSEWVAPNWMLKSPTFAPVIRTLETARVRGFADGGLTGIPGLTQESIDLAKSGPLLDEIRLLREDVRSLQLTLLIGEQEANQIGELQNQTGNRRINTSIA